MTRRNKKKDPLVGRLYGRGKTSLKLSNSIAWSNKNCPTKGAYFELVFLLGKCVNFCDNLQT